MWTCSTFNFINHLFHVLFSNTFRTPLTAFLIPYVLSFTLISCWEAYNKLTMFNPKKCKGLDHLDPVLLRLSDDQIAACILNFIAHTSGHRTLWHEL